MNKKNFWRGIPVKFIYGIIFCMLAAASGCSSSDTILIKKYKTVYEPVKSDSVTSYYVSGIPFGSYENDKYSMLFTIQATNILDNEFLSFWVLLKNKEDDEYLLEPTKIFRMSIYKSSLKEETIDAVSPLSILKVVEYSRQTDLVMAAIGSALKTISARTESGVIREGERLERKMTNINNWYSFYSESLNDGILRKNTIFKDKSVNGVVYFMPSDEVPNSEKMAGKNYEIRVNVTLPNETKEFRFKPVKGE